MVYSSNVLKVVNALQITIGDQQIQKKVSCIANEIKKCTNKGKVTAIFGNGGSAADAQHLAAELVCTYKNRKRKPYKAIALNTDTSIMTAWSNDFDFESIFSRQLEAFGETIGFSIGLSTSGKSKNVLKALNFSKSINLTTCLICGKNDLDYEDIDIVIKIPSEETATIQTVTQVIYHSICDALEK